MKRGDKQSEKNKKPLWRKVTQGFVRIRSLKRGGINPRIKPGEKVRLTAEELGPYFSQFELLEEGKGKYKGDKFTAQAEPVAMNFKPKGKKKQTAKKAESKKAGTKEEEQELFRVDPVENSPGWYNVVDASGKVLNNKKLRSDEAEERRQELIGKENFE